jgi:flagellar basal body-associated protein FliL
MFRKIFSLSNGALFVALALSTIAAWYSIIGLTAIFAGAVMPIIIMGSALELAKITTTVWLRKYWHRCALIMKIYLVPAVVLLALLTSMGIFGFLSKAHLDQGIGTGDVSAQVSLLDEKIAIQRENIKQNRAALAQMDTQVNDIMSKGDSERSVERSVTIRRQQAPERAKLLKEIEVANANIAKLNEERAPIASEMRKAEAEVGPIKYIAALIYGDQASQSMLEAAVRWVIILLVIVFDPLAIMLVIAANQSKEWDEEEDKKDDTLPVPVTETNVVPLTEEQVEQIQEEMATDLPTDEVTKEELTPLEVTSEEEEAFKSMEPKEETILDKHPYLNEEFVHFQNLTPMVHKPESEVEDTVIHQTELTPIITEIPDIVDITPKRDDTPDFEGVKDPVTGEWIQTGPAFLDHPAVQETSDSDYVLYNGKRMSMEALRSLHPELFLVADNPREPNVDFGVELPKKPVKGDTFVRTDYIPNKVFKFNGKNWVEVNKNITETYLSNENYLSFLVEKIGTGEYDPELLTPQEQDAITQHIKTR